LEILVDPDLVLLFCKLIRFIIRYKILIWNKRQVKETEATWIREQEETEKVIFFSILSNSLIKKA
jgi:hypothetical protein